MGAPKVSVSIANGAIGGLVASLDGVCAMELTGVTATGLNLLTPKVIYSLKEAEDLGITSGSSNDFAWRQISEFYAGYNYITGLERAELWIMMVANTVTLTQMADKDHASGAKSLLDAAQGRVRMVGFARNPSAYSPTITAGIDPDTLTASAKALILGNTYATANKPLRCVIEARMMTKATFGDLADLSLRNENRCQIFGISTKNDGSSSVGLGLGIYAGLRVSRNIARVLNGKLPYTDLYFGDTHAKDLESYIDTLTDKHYVAPRTFVDVDGIFANYDYMCTANTDDYCQMSRGRTVDKMHRIGYATYVQQLADDVNTVEGGKLEAGTIGYLEQIIDTNINLNMVDELSNTKLTDRHGFVNADQNVSTTGKTAIVIKGRVKAHLKEIELTVGLEL